MINWISFLESFFSTFALMRITGMETTSPFSIILFIGCVYIYQKLQHIIQTNQVGNTDHLHSGILSLLFTIFTVLYSYEKLTINISSNLFCAFILLGCTIGFFLIFYHFLLCIFLKSYEIELNDSLYPVTFLPVIAFFLCMLFWIPYLLFEFPGVMTPDSINQFSQAVGVWQLNNKHSVIHTLLIMLCYKLGFAITKDPVASIAFYTVFQMIFMAFCVSYTIRTFQKAKLRTSVCIVSMLFYALLPYQGIFVVTIWKDIIFSGCVTLFTASLIQLFLLDTRNKRKLSEMITIFLPYCISGFGICLLRSNGLIAFIIAIPFILLIGRERWKQLLPATAAILVLALFIRFPCMNIYKIPQADFVESLSIPAQQLARVVANRETLSASDADWLNQYMDTSQIASVYDPHVSDPVKYLIRETSTVDIEKNKGNFLSLWFHIGLKHPKAYLDGFIDQTYGYWYPKSDVNTGLADGIYPNDLGLSWKPVISGNAIIKIREILFKLQEMIPLYGLLWSMGAAFWAVLISIANCFVRRNTEKIAFLILPVMLVLTLIIASPVAADFRYAYPVIFGLPLFLLAPFM